MTDWADGSSRTCGQLRRRRVGRRWDASRSRQAGEAAHQPSEANRSPGSRPERLHVGQVPCVRSEGLRRG
jgi:hypothetical protein